jgi:biotin carboxylase
MNEIIDALAKNENRDVLVERFIDGDAGSVEIIGEPGHYVFQHPCWMGPTERSIADTFNTIRVSHPGLFSDVLNGELRHNISRLLGSLRFRGACCVDFVATGQALKVLEINPRVSGVSCLSAAASGLNAFEATYLISTSRWAHQSSSAGLSQGAAVQAGGREADKILAALTTVRHSIHIYRNNEIVVDGERSRSVIIGGRAHDIELFLVDLGVRLPLASPVRQSTSSADVVESHVFL